MKKKTKPFSERIKFLYQLQSYLLDQSFQVTKMIDLEKGLEAQKKLKGGLRK